VIGPEDPTECKKDPSKCGEANLDVQYITSIAEGATTWFWSIDATSQDPFTDWVYAVDNEPNAPFVHSISYGGYEYESTTMDSFNLELQKLGLRGMSVIISSGDDGVANYNARGDASQCGYNPSFPATSPFATAVGATQGPESNSDEVACTSSTGGLITTGGGFSTIFDRPSYQDKQVTNYLNIVSPQPYAGFNTKGRGIPDVAIMGHNYVIVDGGQFEVESGTSASAPVFAGMITLVNNARLLAGKKTLGFLNQALYNLDSSIWNDITKGENNCCAGQAQPICCKQGFTAAIGWDPLTGLGTPKFDKFLAALLAL